MLARKQELALGFNTPNIRPDWSLVKEDDQNRARAMTPAKAIAAGVLRIVIGRPITQAENPREAAELTIKEIREAQAAIA
jgi:orotidine-5'-phosphate decarboxylase